MILVSPIIGRTESNFGGTGSIAGTVTDNGAAAPYYVVRLYHRHTGRVVSGTKSGANGAYSFQLLAKDRAFFLIAHDRDAPLENAAVSDLVYAT